ncbi:hypothetical protein NDU88_005187 [Pleurodeles waltl]|uniref:Uncharacterized protein n=1 Tax=Pleurodeles waltl TaxID=8319 RepID=A0AAV7NM03_PLEWA|nr:hypothetical protein NDU88_005187 [Pleurodeles waltl]
MFVYSYTLSVSASCRKAVSGNVVIRVTTYQEAQKVGWAQAKLAGGSQLEIFDQGLERTIDTLAPRAVIIPKVRRVQSAPWFSGELKDLQKFIVGRSVNGY